MFSKEYKGLNNPVRSMLAALFFIGLCISSLNAQITDTLKVVSDYGDPGDSVTIGISLSNPIDAISGFEIYIKYDTLALSTSTSSIYRTSRCGGYAYFSPSITNDTIRVVAFDYGLADPIEPGSGNIFTIRFLINEDATGGVHNITFLAHSEDHPNFTNLSIPRAPV